jgi:hypothetical protein
MPAVNRYYSSVAVDTTLSFSITNTDLSIVVGSTAGFPTSYPYTLAIGYDQSSEELVTIVGASGNTLTVGTTVAGGANVAGRGVDSTNDQPHVAGEPVKHVISARDMTEAQAHIAAESGAHGVTGAIVGTTDLQTLSSKTLASPTITGTITGAVVTSANIVDGTITGTDIASGTITSTNILDGTIVDADINASAAIAQSKVSGLTSDLALKAPIANPTFTGTVAGVTKGMVGLGNVDNTTDIAKPISTATGTALVNLGNTLLSEIASTNSVVNTKVNRAGDTVTGGFRVNGTTTLDGVVYTSGTNLRIDGDVVRVASGGQGTTAASGVVGVTHNLGRTPTGVTVTMRTVDYTAQPRIFVVTNVTSTSFNVYALNTAGTQQVTSFYWTAVG